MPPPPSSIAPLITGQDRDIRLRMKDEDIVILVTTSGSTARPKGVMFSNRAICEHNMWQAVSDPLTGPYRRLLVAPMSTSAGTMPFLHTMLSGGTAFLETKFDAAQALHFITEEGVVLRQMFSQTECGGTGVINSRHHALSHPEMCGGMLMFTDVAVMGPDDALLPPRRDGRNRAARAGDDGRLLELGVEEVAVIAARDDRFGEVPMAVVFGGVPETDHLIAHCCEHLSNFKVPRYLIRSDGPLPRLAPGEISKPALRVLYSGDAPLPERVR